MGRSSYGCVPCSARIFSLSPDLDFYFHKPSETSQIELDLKQCPNVRSASEQKRARCPIVSAPGRGSGSSRRFDIGGHLAGRSKNNTDSQADQYWNADGENP